jgi:hypothetical protein
MSIVMCILCLNIGVVLGMLLSGILREQRGALARREHAGDPRLPVGSHQGARPATLGVAGSPLSTAAGAPVSST